MPVLSWTLGVGLDSRGGNKKAPEWSDIAGLIDAVSAAGGTVTLETTGDAPWRNLQLQADSGNLLLTLADDEGEVRMLDNPLAGTDDVEILGDVYSASSITRDPRAVEEIFRQLFETGDVAPGLLS